MEKKHIDGLEAVNRVRLLMQYSLEKTLSENITELSVLNEQYYVAPKFPYTTTSNAPKVPVEMQKIIDKQGLKTQLLLPRPETSKNNWEKDKKEYQSENPDMVWDPNVYDTTRPSLDKNGKTIYPKGNWVEMTQTNVGLRGTPFGFHPSEYSEYLKKVTQIKSKYLDRANPTGTAELAKLRQEYYHEDFPYGITKEDYKDWSTARASLDAEKKKEFDKITKEYSTQYKSYKTMPGSDYFLNVANQNVKKSEIMNISQAQSSFKTMDDFLTALFQYDPVAYKEINKGWLEKKWDDYGWTIEILGWIILDVISEGWLIPVSEARLTVVLAKAVKILLRSGLPVASGIFRSYKAGHITEDAVMDFVFAILPWAHNYFNIPKKPSIALVESIVLKRKGLNLTNLGDIRKYIKSLTEEEKYFFKKVFMLDKNQLGAGLQKSMKEIGIKSKQLKTINKIGDDVLKTTGKKIKPSIQYYSKEVGKFLGRIVFLDLPAIEFGKILARKFGFLDNADKLKALEEEFKKKQENPVDVTILFAKAIEVIEKYPDLSTNETITKINEKYINSIETAFEIISKKGLLSFFTDENGEKFVK